ncbi:MAG: signal recognition particle-docking protein FtsY [Actinomycetes bacterium]
MSNPLLVLIVALVAAAAVIGYRVAVARRSQSTLRVSQETTEERDGLEVLAPETDTALHPNVGEQQVADTDSGLDSKSVIEDVLEEATKAEATRTDPLRLRDRLGRTRAAFAGALAGVSGRSSMDDEAWESLEEALILADVGVSTATQLVEAVKARAKAEKIKDGSEVEGLLRQEIALLLSPADRTLQMAVSGPTVWMFVGVNGVGKTTTIAKLATREGAAGRHVVLAAADTFRAAAAEQLGIWAERSGATLVRGDEGADPGSVVFNAMASANSRGADLVLVDTAGRLHTKVNLMEELKKLRRIVDKTPDALTEVILVLDATTGQNGLTQAREFAAAVEVTGVALTKLDGTAKGGIVLAIQSELGIPVKIVGVGEGPEDLIPFDPEEFAAALFGE